MWQPAKPGGNGCSSFATLVPAAGSQFKLSGHWSLTNLAALLPKVHEEAFNRNCSINQPDLTGAGCQAERWPAHPLWALPALLSTPAIPMFPINLLELQNPREDLLLCSSWLCTTRAAASAPLLQSCGVIF